MSAGTIILWRHGQTEFNATKRLQGQSDIALNAVGRRQAARAAGVLATLEPTRIVTSDLVRAAETAGVLADLAGVEAAVDTRLRERSFGLWEGLTGEEIEAGWPAEHAAWRAGREPAGVGTESRAACGQRVAEAVEEAAGELERDDVLVVVAHGAAITCGQTVLLGLDPSGWMGLTGLENCRWSSLHPNGGRAPAWRLAGYNIGAEG
ncbi:histidine phosphatase family protein [Georgenia yuyongxinii]|uniref:Histidine phosphatase family protein n=1 Tax=Georgenia yuyongxinii TaxID=2589797 RepID=A0A552WPG0_9MICO|nr:histidine phosphatase family protein [Georgenia yuyongxinii]TRW44597.1 histidine phosphatase family protein [Georgenia yuyongxinii]